MKLSNIFLILLTSLLLSCGGKTETQQIIPAAKDPYEKLKTFNWFIGTWGNVSDEGVMTEKWVVLNDSVFKGSSFYIEKGDTLFSETMTLEQRGNDIFYVPVVKDQNNGNPTIFKLKNLENVKPGDKVARFENPTHDFPQIVLYQLKGDSMLAEIAGKLEGKDHVEKFPMVKMKQEDVVSNGVRPDK